MVDVVIDRYNTMRWTKPNVPVIKTVRHSHPSHALPQLVAVRLYPDGKLRLNKTTTKLAHLDGSEYVSVTYDAVNKAIILRRETGRRAGALCYHVGTLYRGTVDVTVGRDLVRSVGCLSNTAYELSEIDGAAGAYIASGRDIVK